VTTGVEQKSPGEKSLLYGLGGCAVRFTPCFVPVSGVLSGIWRGIDPSVRIVGLNRTVHPYGLPILQPYTATRPALTICQRFRVSMA
jgi:hypothetical protein